MWSAPLDFVANFIKRTFSQEKSGTLEQLLSVGELFSNTMSNSPLLRDGPQLR